MVQSACRYVEAYRFGRAFRLIMTKKCHVIIPTDLRSFAKSICFNLLTCRLHHWLDLEQWFNLPTDFLSFFDQSSQNGEKNHFLALASRVSQIFWGSYRSKILPDSDRASKTLQFGHQFCPNLSIQSGDTSKIVKNVKIDHQIHLVK